LPVRRCSREGRDTTEDETAYDLLEDRDDYQIVIEYLEKAAGKSLYSSYKRQLLAALYEELGDDEASLRALEKDLKYGMDYWRLAQYWISRRQNDKALEVVKEGLEKGESRKEELYLYMQKHHERRKDYDAVLLMLLSKIQDARGGYHNQFYRDDSLLAQIYDYKGNTDDLWKTVQDSSSLLIEYEDKLAPIYPAEYLEQYQKIVTRYIKNRGRENYRSATQYAERIKRLYRDVLKEPEGWKTYIQELRTANKNLPAMQDEFSISKSLDCGGAGNSSHKYLESSDD